MRALIKENKRIAMVNWYHSLSLHSKQILIIIAINAISLLVASALYFYNNVSGYQERQVNELEGKAKIIAGTLTSALLFQDRHSAHEQLKALSDDKSVLYAGIFDANKNFFAHYIPSSHYPRPDIRQYDAGLHYDVGSLSILNPVFFDNERIGYLFLAQDTSDLDHQMVNHAMITLLVFIMSLLFAYTLSMLMQKWLSKPIKDLVELIQHITSSNDFSQRLTSGSNDEIGQLIQSFNSMIDAIQQRDLKLKMHGEELQDLVNLRTRQLYQRSNYDSLTKLPNRNFFIERLEYELNLAKKNDTILAVIFIDLDRFKVINDTLGHYAGDNVLKILTERLTGITLNNDNLARWGGDEFVLFLPNMKNQEQLSQPLDKISSAIEKTIPLNDRELHISSCMGISLYPKDGDDALNLLKRADISANKAKQRGAGTITFYQPELDKTYQDRLSLETKLRKALENNELSVVYQPKINIKKNELAGVEALIRWNDDELGPIPPDQFIPLAEEIGIINKIGDFVLETCFKQHAEWRLFGLQPIKIAINLSPTHLAEPTLFDSIKQKLRFYKISPEYIELEITEETFLDAGNQCQKNLMQFNDFGISIALDDFGTGYSCLSYLLDIPVSTLKIDGSFIKKLGTRPENDGIVTAIMALGQGLNLDVVAECVETPEQLSFLKQNGCDIIQGYYFSAPLNANKLKRYVEMNFDQTAPMKNG